MMKDSSIQGCSEPGPTAQSERKCSLFNLTLSFLHFFFVCFRFFFFWCQFFQHQGELLLFWVFFLSSYTSTCTPALERELLVGDGWMEGWKDGCSEEEDCERTARDDIIVFLLVCSLNVDVHIISPLYTIKCTESFLSSCR